MSEHEKSPLNAYPGVVRSASVSSAYLAVDWKTSCPSRWVPRLQEELIRACRQSQEALKMGDSDLATVRLRKAAALADRLASLPESGLEPQCLSLGRLLAEALRYRRAETLGQMVSLLEACRDSRGDLAGKKSLHSVNKMVASSQREWTG